jgi:hypothetical protein
MLPYLANETVVTTYIWTFLLAYMCKTWCLYLMQLQFTPYLTLQSPVVSIHTTCFNILCILPTQCTCVFRVVLTLNSNCFSKQWGGNVFPVRYKLNFYILFRINSVFKGLKHLICLIDGQGSIPGKGKIFLFSIMSWPIDSKRFHESITKLMFVLSRKIRVPQICVL